MINTIIITAALLLLEWIYIIFARKINLCVPSSTGTNKTPVGGGFIFYLGATAALLSLGVHLDANVWLLLAGGAVLWVLSFADDTINLPAKFRLAVQIAILSVVLMPLWEQGCYGIFFLCLTGCVGYTNSSNFMDGINGMLALNSAVVLLTLMAVPIVLTPSQTPSEALPSPAQVQTLATGLLIAVTVFAFFNVRRKAKVFSGDVGSVCMGYFIGMSIVWLSLIYRNVTIPVLVSLFLIDTFYTFIQRLIKGENVLQAHRKHLYQLLTQRGIAPLKVSAGYAAVQLSVNAGWLAAGRQYQLPYSFTVFVLLSAVYFTLKRRLNRN